MTNDENNRELNEFFYELATGVSPADHHSGDFRPRLWMLRGSSGATRSKAR